MRLWSLHPSYLDRIGLVAVWREALLAQKVLQGKTQGYRFHPQLYRFQAQLHPDIAIEAYLWGIYKESEARGYQFDRGKFGPDLQNAGMHVTVGQLEYELNHLRKKLKIRDLAQYTKLLSIHIPQAHPLFQIVPGPIEEWERTENAKAHPTPAEGQTGSCR